MSFEGCVWSQSYRHCARFKITLTYQACVEHRSTMVHVILTKMIISCRIARDKASADVWHANLTHKHQAVGVTFPAITISSAEEQGWVGTRDKPSLK